MIEISTKRLGVFFLFVSLFYVLSPIIGLIFFGHYIGSLEEYLIISALIISLVTLAAYRNGRKLFIPRPKVKSKLISLTGILFFLTFLFVKIRIYGSFSDAVLASYISRTGVEFSGWLRYAYYPLITFSAAYVNLALFCFIYGRGEKKSIKIILLIVPILFILLFLISGNRNLVLWCLALPLAVYVGSQSSLRTLMLVFAMLTTSFIVAAYRNVGYEEGFNFYVPPWEYWNPMVHEYGTTYRVYDLIVNFGFSIEGYDFPLQSYLVAFINLLPSVIKPVDFLSFSDTLSLQYAEFGEGIGNSPVAEIVYNWYMPAIFIQVLPFLIIFFLLGRTKGRIYKCARCRQTLACICIAVFVICAFNFWRIGFSELVKISFSYSLALFVLMRIFFKSPSTEH